MNNTCAIILAAGKGTRMNTSTPKVLTKILYKPLLSYVLEACLDAKIPSLCTVVGYESEQIKSFLSFYDPFSIQTVEQSEQLGTGHAVMMAQEFLEANCGKDVCILCGDAPCISGDVLKQAYQTHKNQKNAVTVVTAMMENPYGYGRILHQDGTLMGIIEQADATPQQQQITTVNSGVYWFSVEALLSVLPQLTTRNEQREYYLPQTIELFIQQGRATGIHPVEDSSIVWGVNSRAQQLHLNEHFRQRLIQHHCEQGVEFLSTDGVIIGPHVTIGRDSLILPGTIIKPGVTIGNHCTIGPNTLIEDSQIGDYVLMNQVQCYASRIHNHVDIGPFVHIRPHSEIKSQVHIGDFVEVKNSSVGEGSCISHLTYVGDSDVGKNVNFGCGVVTVNYDGVHKARCTIEDNAFLGCNTNLIAPVTVGNSAYTAAGSTINQDVPDGALAIARCEQKVKLDYANKLLLGRKKKYSE